MQPLPTACLLPLLALVLTPAAPQAAPLQTRMDLAPREFESLSPVRLRAELRFDGERFVAGPEDYQIVDGPAPSARFGSPGTTSSTPGPGSVLEPGLPERLFAGVLCIDASTSNGFFNAGTTGAEWMDWAGKECSERGQISHFAFGYASSARDVSEGGPGAALGLSFYEGTEGFCSRGALARTAAGAPARFDFFGLPGARGSQTTPGYFITVALPDDDPLHWADGSIGWSYTFLDDDGTGDAQTGPIMVEYSASTSWADAFDLWSRPDEFATCAGTFFFGGCSLPLTFGVPSICAGFYVQAWEGDCTFRPSVEPLVVAPNVEALAAATSPELQRPFLMTQTPLTPGSLVAAAISTSTSLDGLPLPFLGGTLLHALPPFLFELDPIFPGGVDHTWSMVMPNRIELCSLQLCAQGFDLTLGPLQVRAVNALRIQVGTP